MVCLFFVVFCGFFFFFLGGGGGEGGSKQVLQLSKKEGKDQESIHSSTTPDPGYQWESDNVTNRHITNESQEVSPFSAGDHKATTNRRA